MVITQCGSSGLTAAAARDDRAFARFKAEPAYRDVLEHVSAEQGRMYAHCLAHDYPALAADAAGRGAARPARARTCGIPCPARERERRTRWLASWSACDPSDPAGPAWLVSYKFFRVVFGRRDEEEEEEEGEEKEGQAAI